MIGCMTVNVGRHGASVRKAVRNTDKGDMAGKPAVFEVASSVGDSVEDRERVRVGRGPKGARCVDVHGGSQGEEFHGVYRSGSDGRSVGDVDGYNGVVAPCGRGVHDDDAA